MYQNIQNHLILPNAIEIDYDSFKFYSLKEMERYRCYGYQLVMNL